MHARIGPAAFIVLRTLAMVALATMLILVLLPAVLSAEAASAT
jgi:hypothetical protein